MDTTGRGGLVAAFPFLLVLPIASAVRPQSGPPLALEEKIPLPDVEGRIDHLSIDVARRRLFVAALGNDTVEVLDLKAAKRVQTIRGLAEPQGVLFVPDADRLFVANGKDGTLRIFDGSSLALLRAIPMGDDADNVRPDPTSGRIWVGYGEGALGAVDPKGATLATVRLAAHPESFQIETNGPRIFVNVPRARQIAVVDRSEGVVTATWGTGDSSANFPMALDEANGRLFVVCRTPPRLLVVRTDSGRVAAELPTVGDADDVFFDRSVRRVYVSGGEGAIVVYRQDDPDHYRQAARLDTAEGARTTFFSPDLRELFLAVRRRGETPAAIWVYRVVD